METLNYLTKKAYGRACLAGNPSDNFWGKCVSICISNFSATTKIRKNNKITIKSDHSDKGIEFEDADNLMGYVKNTMKRPSGRVHNSHYLVLANIKTFYDFCSLNGIELDYNESFELVYASSIPVMVGFASSTAIGVSVIRALAGFHNIELTADNMEGIVLHAETHECARVAGPQDPSSIIRGGFLDMDFSKEKYREMLGDGLESLEKAITHYDYSHSDEYLLDIGNTEIINLEHFKPKKKPNFFIAYSKKGSDSSIPLRSKVQRYKNGEKKIIDAMKEFSALAPYAKKCLEDGDFDGLGEVMNAKNQNENI